jgi:inhibitor of cysteine peptidase
MKKLTIVFFLLALFGCGSSGGGDVDATNPTTYSITGQITSNSTGLAGVTVLLSGASTAETTTDSGGNYSFTGHSNGNYTVTPSLSEYTFSPVSTDITVAGANQANIDFTATYTIISGKVSGDVLSDVTITLTGTSSGSTLTDSSGNYSFSGVANGGYTITASKTGYTFSPLNISATVSNANLTGQNFTSTAITTPTYSISGTVGGAVQLGVTITLTGSGSNSTTTDASGNYSFSGAANGSYTITPSKTGYTFSPLSLSITVSNANLTGQNFTATTNVAPTYSISGTVGGAVASGVTITLTGTGSVITITDSSGNYSFSGTANGNYTITASKTGYTFSPIFSITVNGANITGQNFTATATFQLSLTTSYAGPINYGTIYVREIFVNVTGTPSLQAVTLNLIRNESGGHLSSSTTFGGKVYYYAGQLKPDSQVIDIIQASIENVKSNDLVVVRNASF